MYRFQAAEMTFVLSEIKPERCQSACMTFHGLTCSDHGTSVDPGTWLRVVEFVHKGGAFFNEGPI